MSVIKPNEINKRFSNPWGVNPCPASKEVLRWAFSRAVFFRDTDDHSKIPPNINTVQSGVNVRPGESRVTWLGHSTILIEQNGKRILVDPCFSDRLGFYKRLSPVPVMVSDLGRIDAVLISHGHHDHCDLKSLKMLCRHSEEPILFLVPKGLGKKISSFASLVLEFSWWEKYQIDKIEISFVPAQHWHRRGIFDYNKALWGGWVIQGDHVIYHSGDTGYFKGFELIKDNFKRRIDLAVLPIGAYLPRWLMEKQHMSPDESIQAFLDLAAKNFLAMHWGAFKMADDEISEGPIELRESLLSRGISNERFHVLMPAGELVMSGDNLKSQGIHREQE